MKWKFRLSALWRRGILLALLDAIPESAEVKRIIATLDRKPEERRHFEGRRSRVFRTLFFLSMLGCGLVLFVPALWNDSVATWLHPPEYFRLPTNGWRVYYPGPRDAQVCDGPHVAPNCIASPEHDALWKSTLRRGTEMHRTWLTTHRGQRFWIGQRVEDGILRRALAHHANQLLIGYLVGSARIWLNGILIYEQTEWPLEPIVIAVPSTFLEAKSSLAIAIELTPSAATAFPDYLNESEGGEGFGSIAYIDAYKGYENFIGRVRPASLALGNFIIALLFIFFWRNVPLKQEYFFLACLALSESLYQFRLLDWVRKPLTGHGTTYRFQFFLSFVNGVLALCLGIAFARFSKKVTNTVLSVCALTFACIICLYPDPLSELAWSGTFSRDWVPGLSILGALVCILQAYSLNHDSVRRDYLVLRIERLLLFAGALFFLAILQMFYGASIISSSRTTIIQNCGFFFSVVVLSAIAIRDYRESEQFRQDLAPLSEHIDLVKKGACFSGGILYLDMKKSEPIIRGGELRGDTGFYLRPIMRRLCDHLAAHGGLRFTLDGDMVKAVFPDRTETRGSVRAIEAVAAMGIWLQTETEKLIAAKILSAEERLAFRAGLSVGFVRAAMNETGPAFEHVDSTTPLLDAARMLKMEEEHFKSDSSTTVIVMTIATRDQVMKLLGSEYGTWREREFTAEAKHRINYAAAAFVPYNYESTTQRAA